MLLRRGRLAHLLVVALAAAALPVGAAGVPDTAAGDASAGEAFAVRVVRADVPAVRFSGAERGDRRVLQSRFFVAAPALTVPDSVVASWRYVDALTLRDLPQDRAWSPESGRAPPSSRLLVA